MSQADDNTDTGTPPAPRFADALRWWFKLGCISFGGPAGQIALMHDELVEHRRWIDEQGFLRALNYCILPPGPEAKLGVVPVMLACALIGLMSGLLMSGQAVLG